MIPELYYTLEPGATAPRRASQEAAGYDLFAHHDAVIEPGRTVLVSAGIRLAIPAGYEAQVRPRSGLSLRTPLRIANSPGTIDADYRGLVSIICENTASLLDPYKILQDKPELIDTLIHDFHPVDIAHYYRDKLGIALPFGLPTATVYLDGDGYPLGTIFIKAGERIAQLVIAKVVFPDFVEAEDVSLIGQDRGGGFGSTGKL